MPKPAIPPAELELSKEHARRFLLAHHRLAPPRRLKGKQGLLDYVRHVNCIQYDPINIVGQNSHLVLQSRVRGYRPAMLDEALYQERTLLDGFDKVMSIYPTEDWPYFARHREEIPKSYAAAEQAKQAMGLVDSVRKELETRGPLSSLELEDDSRMTYWSNTSTRNARVALEVLFLAGEAVVHHRVGTRRYYEPAARVLPRELLAGANPHRSVEEYLDWHVLRRVGSLGLGRPGAGPQWGGVLGSKSSERHAAIHRLTERGQLARVNIEGLAGQQFYLRTTDLPALEAAGSKPKSRPGAAFLAALDNLMWDRDLIEMLFDFYYRWEVYVSEPKRKYGFYVLPVLHGSQFVARIEPKVDRAARILTLQNWWWEKGVDKKDDAMLAGLQDCVRDFCKYLGASDVKLGENVKRNTVLREVVRTL